MPELPEIETLRRSLDPRLRGRAIVAVRVREPRLRAPVDAAALRRWTRGTLLGAVGRRGKFLLLTLDNGAALVAHMGMSGQLLVVARRTPLDRHDHVILALDDGSELRLRDPRRFGLLEVVPPGAATRYARLESLGPEPLERGFDGAYLRGRARGSRRPVKSFLMDAQVVVGVGNIYASEALHAAGISPRRAAGKLSVRSCEELVRAVRATLRRAIRSRGTTLRDFVDADGRGGGYGIRLAVYDREGEPCLGCGAAVRRIVQAGRSTFFCSVCQK